MGNNVTTFLWRTLFVQAVCRRPFSTAFELLWVVVFFYLSLQGDRPPQPLGEESAHQDADAFLVPKMPSHVLFGPGGSGNEKLMRAAMAYIEKHSNYSEEEGSSSSSQLTSEDVTYIAIDQADRVANSCAEFLTHPDSFMIDYEASQSKTKGKNAEGVVKSHPTTKHPLCVALGGQADGDVNLTYTVYAPTSIFATMNPALEKVNDEGILERAVQYEYIIEHTHIELKRAAANSAGSPMQMKVENLAGWVFDGFNSYYRQTLFSAMYLAFLVPLLRRIGAIEYEFSSGLAEHQAIMGLSSGQFLAGHFLTAIVFAVLQGASAIAIMYLVKLKDSEIPYAHDVDPSLLAASFAMFHVGHTLFAIMLAWVFPEGWTGQLLGILSMMVGPAIIEWGQALGTVPQYILAPRAVKLRAGVLPHMGTAYILRIIFLARDYEGRAGWSLVGKRALERDNVSILEMWAVMLASDAVMMFLAWYLSKVLPWSTNNPQNPFFCLMGSYWKPSPVDITASASAVDRDPRRFEQLPPNRRPLIVTQDLVKAYGKKTALNGLDFVVYEYNVTVLLGHNGAGKTTLMSILTGMQAPTSGVARVCGLDVATQRDEIRKKVSFCQQTDIFFEDLTSIQNLLYFGSLKGARSQDLAESVRNALSVVKLEEKAHNMPMELSGGMKRRLSIAITLVSKPEVLILDEPTTGMDPETRRAVWDVMQNVAKERTVLLSSHDMDEADAIGDQIIVMSGGKVVCSGSTAFLKKACGVGYKLTLVKVPNVFNLNGVHALVKETAPTAEVDEDKQEEAVFTLHTLDHKRFPHMFEALEGAADRLGVAKMGVTVASMKDVYLKINMDWAPGGKQRDQPVDENDIAAVCRPITKERSLRRCFYALWAKRLVYLARSWGLLLSCCVLPLLLVLLVVSTLPSPTSQLITEAETGSTLPIELRLATYFPEATIIVQQAPAAKDVIAALRVLVESQGCSVHIVDNITRELRNEYLANFAHYMGTFPFAIAFETDAVRLMVNPTRPGALPIAINLVDTAELRVVSGQPLARIDGTITYLKLPSGGGLILGTLSAAWGVMYWPLLPALSYSLAISCFAAFPVAERLGGARDVQLMTGISGAFFVATHALFDLVHYAVVMGLWCLLHFLFSDYGLKMAGHIALSFACFAPSVIGLTYLLAEMAVSPGKAMANTVLAVYPGAMMAMGSFEAINAVAETDSLRYLFLMFPPYALIRCLEKITTSEMDADMCQQSILQMKKRGEPVDWNIDFCNNPPLLAFGKQSIGTELLFMVGVGLTLLTAMSFLISGYLLPESSFEPKESKLDDDVEEHRRLVDKLKENRDFGEQAVVAWRLHKRYGALHVVKGVSLALRPSECFGLLGVNGAGKTTTFQMLAKMISASYGDAYTAKAQLSGNTRQWQSQISYCFQLGGLLDRLNAYEYLYLVGRLRGISDADLGPMVNGLLSVVDLKEHANKECGVYSGGNRRKLSIGAALLGLSPLVFLDEPYAGVDVVSRNKIFRAISTIQKRSSSVVVLTSHNMEECEFSCDRLTIMAAGEMMCLGTLQHLREKFGQGYRLELAMRHDKAAAADAQRVTQAVQQQFPGATVTEEHENVRGYHLTERMPWSELFRRLNRLEEELALQHAIVGENTLEQIFLQFAKEEEKHKGATPQRQLVTAVPSRPDVPPQPTPAAPAVAS